MSSFEPVDSRFLIRAQGPSPTLLVASRSECVCTDISAGCLYWSFVRCRLKPTSCDPSKPRSDLMSTTDRAPACGCLTFAN